LTTRGFWRCGPTVKAFVAGEHIATTILIAAAAAVSLPRLQPTAAAVFMLFTSLMVLMPVNVGDGFTDFTFAMSYNVYGWAAISILSLALFLPRRRPGAGSWIDAAIGGLLMLALYYLKITYFVAALVELTVAVVLYRHMRRGAWLLAAGLVVANAVAPYNWPYLIDLADVLALPGNFTDYAELGHIKHVLRASVAELLIFALGGGVAVGVWLSGRAPLRLPLTMLLLIAIGAALLVFNTQARGIPLAVVALFLLHDLMQDDAALRRGAPVVLAFPLWLAITATASVVAFHSAAARQDELLVVDRTNLRGLAVPAGDRPLRPGEEIDEDDYIRTIVEAADLLARTENGGQGVVVLDEINPMPFVLGVAPRRGTRLWLDPDFPWRPPETKFAGSRHVLVPKRPVNGAVTRKALDLYSSYLATNFPGRLESRHWTLFSRAP
jgi:hypothetical protein